MKQLLIILLTTLILSSCSKYEPPRKCQVGLHFNDGFSSTHSSIWCDSFQMLDIKTANVWIDGTKMRVEAGTVITPTTY